MAGASATSYSALCPLKFTIDRVNFRMSRHLQHITPAFYLGNSKYRMQVSVYPGGKHEGRDSHVSVYAHILCGDYDHLLEWPFRGRITIRLCSQSIFAFEDHEMDMVYDDATSIDCSGRRYSAGRAPGVGIDHFFPHSELWKYLHDDQLTFELPQVPDL